MKVQEVNQFLNEFEQMRKMIRTLMGQMPGGKGGPGKGPFGKGGPGGLPRRPIGPGPKMPRFPFGRKGR